MKQSLDGRGELSLVMRIVDFEERGDVRISKQEERAFERF